MTNDFTNDPDNFNQKPRANQRTIVPTSTKVRLLEFYNTTNNTIEIKNTVGTIVFSINLTTGLVTLGAASTYTGAVTFSSNVTFSLANGWKYNGITVQAPVKEMQIELLSGGASGGIWTSFYTTNTSGAPSYLDNTRFSINPANFPGCTFLLETVIRAGNTGDPGSWTNTVELYDIAAAAIVTNSGISTTTKSSAAPGGLPRVRGTTDFRANMTTGARDYELRFYTSDGTKTVDLYTAKLIIQY